jgi:hypothetical protein
MSGFEPGRCRLNSPTTYGTAAFSYPITNVMSHLRFAGGTRSGALDLRSRQIAGSHALTRRLPRLPYVVGLPSDIRVFLYGSAFGAFIYHRLRRWRSRQRNTMTVLPKGEARYEGLCDRIKCDLRWGLPHCRLIVHFAAQRLSRAHKVRHVP